MFFCPECKVYVRNYSSHKKSNLHKSNCLVQSSFPNAQIITSAFQNRIISYKVNPKRKDEIAPEVFLIAPATCKTVYQILKTYLKKHISIKVNFELFVSYVLPKNDKTSMKSFKTKFAIVVQSTNISMFYKHSVENLLVKCSEFEMAESGWTIHSISHLEVNINKYSPFRVGSYIPLPKRIQNTKSCLNIYNQDNHCFLWCIVAYMFPVNRNPNRVSSYPHYSKLFNLTNISFPLSFQDIRKFEQLNVKISVNIYGLDDKHQVTGPLYVTLQRKSTHVNLLYLNHMGKQHFCLIKNFARLIRSQLTSHKSKIFLCDECFTYFDNEEKLGNHNCGRIKTVLPESGRQLYFSHFERTQRIPIAIYGDFESLLREYSEKSRFSNNECVKVHEATSFAYYICCKSKPELNNLVSYRGLNCAQKFVECLTNDVKRLYKLLSSNLDIIPLSPDEQEKFEKSTQCHFCRENFFPMEVIVKDHDHFTGKYRGPSHSSCNLNAKTCPFIPIIFHNLSGYDCHLFIKELSNVLGRINIIPRSKEKYISFTKFVPIGDARNVAQIKFLDSFNFLSSSLEKLVSTSCPDDLKNLRCYFNDDDLFNLMCRKGVYCYDYIDSWDKYSETKLPEKSNFFNKLTGEHISESDYLHAVKVWKKFQVKNLGEYTDLYLKSDVLLLSDIFEKFREMSLEFYGLDPCYYVSSPSLSWDAMLLYTKVKLELISDVEMYQMIEKGIRGGLAQCSLRYAKANNKYLSTFDKNEPNTFLIYLDCVNLYGFAMMQKLPMNDFKYLDEQEIANFNVLNISKNSSVGYILEVDLNYPQNIHDDHSDLPFAAEKFAPLGSRNKKLIANLYAKHCFVIHYRHLQECLKNGLELIKIYKILSFNQDNFLEPYISLNTSLRQRAKSDFEKDFFKKQNNSIFGKTIENKRNQVDVKLVQVWRDEFNKTNKLCGAEKYISAPNFNSLSVFSENLVAIQMNKTEIILDRPIYLGFSILEISKTHLYSFHYSIMKNMYGNNIQLCYTDTDSLLYFIKTEDFYSDMKKNIRYFDTSNYEFDNKYNIPKSNMKLPGYFKDEMGGEVISEFVGLRAKLYCIDTDKKSIKKRKASKNR